MDGWILNPSISFFQKDEHRSLGSIFNYALQKKKKKKKKGNKTLTCNLYELAELTF